MFPLRTGKGGCNLEAINNQCLTASVLHEIGKQAIKDISSLMVHQLTADIYYRQEENIDIPINPIDGTFIVYNPEEELEIRKSLMDIVMKYHILHQDGLVAQLTPLVNYVLYDQPLSPIHLNDPIISSIISNMNKYKTNIINNDNLKTLEQIMNFEDVTEQTAEEQEKMILDTFNDGNDDIDVEIYEDGIVQCACKYCSKFFSILEEESCLNVDSLNPLQKLMFEKYNYFSEEKIE
jgi:hypothetical protein